MNFIRHVIHRLVLDRPVVDLVGEEKAVENPFDVDPVRGGEGDDLSQCFLPPTVLLTA